MRKVIFRDGKRIKKVFVLDDLENELTQNL